MVPFSKLFTRLSYYSTAASLPELPVPNLDNSLNKFQATIRPILTGDEHSQTLLYIKEFAKKDGPYLQNKLIQLAKEKINWAAHTFVYDRFLSNRNSLIYSNPVVFVKDKLNSVSIEGMLAIASQYISAFLVMQEDIRHDRLPQEMRGTTPLCMTQYRTLLGSYRAPGIQVDKLHFSSSSRHIVVLYGGHVYKVPVFEIENRKLLSVQEILQLLYQIVIQEKESDGPSVSILTTLDRPEWYSAREELKRSPVNATSLKEIEESLFGVCLEEKRGVSAAAVLKQTTIGGELPFNCWHDLGNQLIVARDGYMGIVYDHAVRDGNMKSPMFNFGISIDLSIQLPDSIRVQKLDWELSNTSKLHIQQAQRKLTAISAKCDPHIFTFTNFGVNFVKNQNLHPNGYLHMAIQLAYYQLYNHLSPCHHSVSLRKFKGGRLEQPFTITDESKSFVQGMLSREKTETQKRILLSRAVAKHGAILNETFEGEVTNKHMRALKLLAEEEGMPVNLFREGAFTRLFNNKFFSSHNYSGLNTHCISFPKSLEGQFILLNLKDNQFNISVTSILNSLHSHSAIQFSQAIEDSLLKMQQLVEKTN